MQPEFLSILERIRARYGAPMRISSGYRCPEHPVEASKPSPGAHSTGLAVDVLIYGDRALELMQIALEEGIHGLGVSQKGDHSSRFIHLDILEGRGRPNCWSY